MEHVASIDSVNIARIDVSEAGRYGTRYRVRPRSDRPTHLEWRYHFFVACEEHPRLNWNAAGFARCRQQELAVVEAALQEAVGEANRRFAELDDIERPRTDFDRSIFETPGDTYPILFP